MIDEKEAIKYFHKYVDLLGEMMIPEDHSVSVSLLDKDEKRGNRGECWPYDKFKHMEISIFREEHDDMRDFVATIYHELVHARMRKIRPLISIKRRREYDEMEEDIVQALEKVFVSMLRKKL